MSAAQLPVWPPEPMRLHVLGFFVHRHLWQIGHGKGLKYMLDLSGSWESAYNGDEGEELAEGGFANGVLVSPLVQGKQHHWVCAGLISHASVSLYKLMWIHGCWYPPMHVYIWCRRIENASTSSLTMVARANFVILCSTQWCNIKGLTI